MAKYRVIKSSSLPARLPTLTTIVFGLLMDRLNSPGWAYGAVGVMLSILWFGAIYRICTDTAVDAPGFGERDK